MKLKERLRERLAKVGATLDDTEYTLNCDAPPGYIWNASGDYNLAIHYATNHQSWLAQALREEESSLRMGLSLADEDEVERIRYDLDDDSWGAQPGAPGTLSV